MNYNYPSEDELLPNSTYNYDLIPNEQDGNINYTPWVYDQFIQLRDTLVYSNKKYNWKAWSVLCIWEKEKTVEVIFRNLFQQNFNNIVQTWVTPISIWPYVKRESEVADRYGQMSCVIQKSWRYKIIHKEEVLLSAGSLKVLCYVDIYRNWAIAYKWWVAVYDRQWNFNKTFSGTTSWTDPNGSCSVRVHFTLWDIIQKMTAFWYMERNLEKWDILVLRTKDQEPNPSTWEPQWNNLLLQADSNYRSIEYLNLPINN